MASIRRTLVGAAHRAKDAGAAVLRDRWANGRFRLRPVVGEPAADGVPIVQCAWARIDRIGEVLANLDAQRDCPPIDLAIWNNRRREHAKLIAGIRAAAPSGAVRSVSVVRGAYNAGSIARFYLARRWWLEGRRGPFLVVDDDQRLPHDFVATALAAHEPGTATGVWAWQVGSGYWDRTRAQPGERVDHLGPGGMIADLRLVADRAFFDDLPLEHWYLDDVWLSYYAPQHGLALRRLPTDVEFVDDDHNIYPTLVEHKARFHDWLRER